MGKINKVGLRLGNTVATPVRRGGAVANALKNLLLQSDSSWKNSYEVSKQTTLALADNFLNFSKVEGKGFQKYFKASLNAVSAVTWRPFLIAGASFATGLNQSLRQPFKKLFQGKIFKDLYNGTRIFSAKEGFSFQDHAVHETTPETDTWINRVKKTRFGFFKGKGGSAKAAESKPAEASPKKEEKPVVVAKKEEKPAVVAAKKEEKPEPKKEAPKAETKPAPVKSEPKTIDEIDAKNKEAAKAKDAAAEKKMFPEWKNLDDKFKKKYIEDYKKLLKGKTDEDGILERAKHNDKGDNIDQVMINVKKENPTMAGYFQELLDKQESNLAKSA